MLGWIKPQTVIPVHGERTQLDAHAQLARGAQIKNVIVPNNGSVIQLAPDTAKVVDHVTTGTLAVDLRRIIPSDHVSIVERRKLQFTGVIHVSMVMSKAGKILGEPILETIGLYDLNDKKDIAAEDRLYDKIFDVVEKMPKKKATDAEYVEDKVGAALRRIVRDTLGLKPKSSVHVITV